MSDTEPAADEPKSWPSIDDAAPEEEGGPVARTGFSYQDEIAVGFLLDMVADPQIVKIHFESHDDLIVARLGAVNDPLTAEYVQVKAGEPDKLWSVADLCFQIGKDKKTGKPGRSILETSLARDRHGENSTFRMVTLRPVVSELAPLTYEMGVEARAADAEGMVSLLAELNKRYPGLKSAKGNGCDYWLENCRWEVCHDIKTVEKANTYKLFALAEAAKQPLLMEQLDVILLELRAWVKAAGDAKWIPDKARKIVARQQATDWWWARLAKLAEAASSPSGGTLVAKMKDADLSDSLIAMAVDLRLGYAREVRAAKYMEPEEAEDLQARVKSTAQVLGAKLEAGALEMSGTQFHAHCLEKLEALNAARAAQETDRSAFIQGCLYDIADRCLLRFDRSAP